MPRVLLALFLSVAIVTAASPAQAVYMVEYGDNVNIVVKDAPQYSYNGPVRPDGVIAVPFLGEIEVAGLTTGQIEQRMTTVLKSFLRDPQVSVILTSFRPQYVTVGGQVGRPGVIQIPRPKATLLDVLAASGNLTERATSWEVLVIRGSGANAKQYVVNVQHMLKTSDFSQNLVIEPGDRIHVPEVWWPNFAEIRRDIALTLSFIATIAAVLALYDRASRTP